MGLTLRVLAEKFSTVFSRVPSRCERERSCFFWILNFFLLEPENVLSNIGQKTRHFSQRSKILVQKNSLPSFPREYVFHFSTLGEKSFRLWEKLLRKSTQFFIFCVQRTFGTFYQRFRLFLDLSLNVWASEEHFSTVFSKMHSRCGSVFLEPALFLSKVGQKSCGCFVKAAKNVRRRLIWYLFPEKMLFRFSTLSGRLQDFEKNFPEKNTLCFIICVQRYFYLEI